MTIFVANLLFVLSIIHDVLVGSYIIKSPLGEVFSYAFFIYMCVMVVVLLLKSDLIEKKYLKSQLNFLHAQINPHFLYNTISTIRAYSKDNPEKTAEMLDYLSVYLRGKLKKGDDIFTSLKEEMELVNAYLTLEKVRFEERLEVEYDIDDNIDIIIPCLVIQPIVENAVKHGLSKKPGGGRIKITVKKDSDNVFITIADNGIGIKTVFITAYKEHAVKAFGVSAVHYLLKPVKKEDLKEAVNRVSEAKKLETGLGEANSISFIKGSAGVSEKISIQESDDISVIKIIDILYIYAHSGNTIITTKFGTYKSRKGLQFWEERLNENGFLRCHKSYLINTEYISKMIHVLGEYKELELCYGDVHIPISRRKVKEVKDWMGVV